MIPFQSIPSGLFASRRFLALVASMLLSATVAPSLCAQSDVSICQELRSDGRVSIRQDSRLEPLLTRNVKVYNAASRVVARNGRPVLTIAGYRIRAFSGNNQQTSRALAEKLQAQIKDQSPELDTYLVFKSPNWRLLVGNYRTNEEALAALRELKRLFPANAQDMFVVKDQIEIVI